MSSENGYKIYLSRLSPLLYAEVQNLACLKAGKVNTFIYQHIILNDWFDILMKKTGVRDLLEHNALVLTLFSTELITFFSLP